MRTTIRAFRLAPAITLLAASLSLAAGFQSFSRADQVRDSDLIVVGRVESLLSYWNGPQSLIQTDARVAIENVRKGSPESERITVRTLGGVVDRVAMEVDGAPRFGMGERVVLFLHERDGVYTLWGKRYGKYRIVGRREEPLALGVLPPNALGDERFREISIALDELHHDVRSVLDTVLGSAR